MTTTKILFTRHEDHVDQVLTPEAHARAVARGRRLKELGYTIDAVVSSPQPRAVRTALAMLEGHGATPLVKTEDRLGDFKSDQRFGADGPKKIRTTAMKQYGNESDSSVAKVMISAEYRWIMKVRAFEGAQALQLIAVMNTGKTILATSHGVARMEVSIRYLQEDNLDTALDILDRLIDRGEVVELTFEVIEKSPIKLVEAKALNLLTSRDFSQSFSNFRRELDGKDNH